MPHDIRFIEPQNIQQAELLFEALSKLAESEGEPWQVTERKRAIEGLKERLLGEE